MHFILKVFNKEEPTRHASVETPETFATIDGATQPREGVNCPKAIAVWQERWVLVLWNL